MGKGSLLIACAVALAAGAGLWLAASLTGQGREPWDQPAYWSIYLPTAVLLSGGLGFAHPDRAWLPPLVLMFSQLLVMGAGSSDLGLWPLALALIAVLSAPAVGAGLLGAALRRRLAR